MRALVVLVMLVGLAPVAATASPNVSLDDPRYDEVPGDQAFAPLTEARMRELLDEPPLSHRAWLRLDRAFLRLAADDDELRPYSTDTRPRGIAGGLALTCERSEGRACIGDGVLAELDTSAGYGDIVSGSVRVSTRAGSDGYAPDVGLDRAYVESELGPLALEIGRDVLVLGPRSRTQLAWGTNAPPLDHVRLSTREPFALTSALHANALYAIARLRDPQQFPGTILTLSRVQLDIGDRLNVGVQQLLMLGGDGAPAIGGPIDFFLEHLRRSDSSATATDSSDRRFGGDVSYRIPELRSRFYYQLMFEDIRRAYWLDAVRFDADHLFGVETRASARTRIVVEYTQTGVRSQHHNVRRTGLTNAGRAGGSPLGPDGESLYAAVQTTHGRATLTPWFERAVLASDLYTFIDKGPILLTETGNHEFRTRVGIDARIALPRGLWLEPHVAVEYVDQFGFEPGADRWNGRLAVDVVWRNF